MSIQRLHTESRYSEIVIHNGTVYLAGQLADDYAGDIQRQTRETLASVERLLTEAGSDKSRLLAVTIHLQDLADYAGMNAVWDAWLPAGCAPARTCVEARLYDPRARVEMSVVAALP
ncbi:MAG: RidA family protein [Pseudomonas sagittaria]|nr:RidA family protein [Pseudomonas sagittaria]